jgi:putative ABC transport system permease protein
MEPHTIVLTKDIANKYFNSEEPVGKLLKIDNELFKVTGVIDNVPANSHFHFDLFVSLSNLPYARDPSWMSSGMFTYIVLKKGYDYKKLEANSGNGKKIYGSANTTADGVELSRQRVMSWDLYYSH